MHPQTPQICKSQTYKKSYCLALQRRLRAEIADRSQIGQQLHLLIARPELELFEPHTASNVSYKPDVPSTKPKPPEPQQEEIVQFRLEFEVFIDV